MKMKIKLDEKFIEKITDLTYEQIYAALWIISGIKHKKRRMNGGEIVKIGEMNDSPSRYIDIYKLGYVQALVDLEQPLRYKSKLPTTPEFICIGLDALGINLFV